VLRVPFGVDPLFFRAARRRVPRGRTTRLLYAGRLQADKGVDLLLEALPALLRRRDVTLTVVGRGPYAARLSRLVHPRLHVRGFVTSREEMADLYAAHDVLLAPGPHETFGLAVLEGLAAGMVVVGAHAGGTGELMAQLPRPCLFRSGDRDDFLRAVGEALDGDVVSLSADAIALAEQYGTWDDAIARQVRRYAEHLDLQATVKAS
jgi:alpha-1,6-mannosyltransferase